MYKLIFDEAGYANAIEKDGIVVIHLLAGANTTIQNAEQIVEQLNYNEYEKEKEFLFIEILEQIAKIGCRSHYHAFREWFMSEDENQREFRLGGNFGFGFKIKRQHGVLYFDQYNEDETDESKKWITKMNEQLRK